MFDYTNVASLDATKSTLETSFDGELVHISHDALNLPAECEDNRVLEADRAAVDAAVDGNFDGELLATYNQNIQRPPQVSTGGVAKHSTRLPTELEACFRTLRPPHACSDPTCKRLHDKQKIHDVISGDLKSLMTSKLSVVEESSP